jgi:hypothetical protein
MDFLTLELIRQTPGILYSVACIIFSMLGPLAAINSVKAYCAMKGASNRKDNAPR